SFVSDFISDAVFEGDRRMYVVATMGQNTGKADEHVSRLVSGKGMEFMGFTGIVMTDNYIVWSGMPGKDVYMETVKKAEDTARSVAMFIREGKPITKTDKTGMAGLKSGFINRMFSKHMNDPGFSFTDRCTSCGVCESFCPANNISMKDGKPVFLMKCFSCFGCIHRCPANAIVIKGKTESRGQYVCPEYGRKE
ncbi:MAG: EFR1 family ferrodoxin, partial [archaeon]|nr:EFR1 family ferrodoxin [archaeon]